MTRIRLASIQDVPQLLPLVAEYWRFEGIPGFEPGRVAAQLERLLSAPGLGRAWMAVANGAPAGYLLGVFVFSLEHLGLTAEIDELFVTPSLRGSGRGGELLRHAEAEFRRAGCTNVSLHLGRANDAARAFYRGPWLRGTTRV